MVVYLIERMIGETETIYGNTAVLCNLGLLGGLEQVNV